MKTRFNEIRDNWTAVKNHCRTTVNKQFTDKEAGTTFKKKLLISEHTPIRLIEFDWTWAGIPYWTAMEWARHKFEKFITSQRDDRMVDDTPRKDKPQGAPVNYDGFANMQNLIDAFRKRLCRMATPEARELAEDFKATLSETHSLEADILVPNCIYRYGCPEFQSCGYWNRFYKWCEERGAAADMLDNIQLRYDLYNEYFYDTRCKNGNEKN